MSIFAEWEECHFCYKSFVCFLKILFDTQKDHGKFSCKKLQTVEDQIRNKSVSNGRLSGNKFKRINQLL